MPEETEIQIDDAVNTGLLTLQCAGADCKAASEPVYLTRASKQVVGRAPLKSTEYTFACPRCKTEVVLRVPQRKRPANAPIGGAAGSKRRAQVR